VGLSEEGRILELKDGPAGVGTKFCFRGDPFAKICRRLHWYKDVFINHRWEVIMQSLNKEVLFTLQGEGCMVGFYVLLSQKKNSADFLKKKKKREVPGEGVV